MRAFRQGVITEALNPKTALFFVSFLPQFARPEAGPLAVQLALLGAISVALNTSADVLVALAAGKLGQRSMATPRLWRRQRKLSGALLVGLGVYAAASDRA
jgi:threonine/homoserine/homoserine lactone efflux protein